MSPDGTAAPPDTSSSPSQLFAPGRTPLANLDILDDDAPLGANTAVVSLSRFLNDPAALSQHEPGVGVRLAPEDDPLLLEGHVNVLRVVLVDFPHFQDGRGYTHARRLRHQLGYTGEMRAVGDVGRDHIQLMVRVGFNSFQLRAGEDLEEIRAHWKDFSHGYVGINITPL